MGNHSMQTEFILLGLTDDPVWQIVVFLFLFFPYVFNVTGNLTLVLLTLLDSHVKTPMYFFLHNFSFLEISFTTVCIPRFLVSLVTKDRTISYMSCMTQFFVVFVFVLFCFSGNHWILPSGCYVLMTIVWPYVNPSITPLSWAIEFATNLYSALGQLDSWGSFLQSS